MMRVAEMVTTALQRQPHPKSYRDRQEVLRHILTYMDRSAGPVLGSRLEIITGTNAYTQRGYLEELENARVIKAYANEWGRRQVIRYTLTKKGRRLLDLMDAQVGMLEGARWIKETTRGW